MLENVLAEKSKTDTQKLCVKQHDRTSPEVQSTELKEKLKTVPEQQTFLTKPAEQTNSFKNL